MGYPPLVCYATLEEYRDHFERVYAQGPIVTFDGIEVRFRRRDFDHCFFESVAGKDDTFSRGRAERIDWIKAALQDPTSERYQGWNKKMRRYDPQRRVTIVMGNYVVVIAVTGLKKADFITAYVAETTSYPGRPSTIALIRKGPKWV